MDISLFSCNKSEIMSNTEEMSVRPKTTLMKAKRCAAAPRRVYRCATTTASPTDKLPSVQKSLSRTPSTFRWRSSTDIVEDSLKGMSFTITGILESLNYEDVVEMIEFCGGTVYKTLAKKSKYLITGNNASKTWIKNAIDSEKTVLNEKQFLDLVRDSGKVQKFLKYREKNHTEEADIESDVCVITSDDSEDN